MDVSGEQDEERVREAFRGPRRLIGSGGRAFRNEADDLVVQPGDEGRDHEPEDAKGRFSRALPNGSVVRTDALQGVAEQVTQPCHSRLVRWVARSSLTLLSNTLPLP